MISSQLKRFTIFASASAITATLSCSALAQVTSNSAPPPNLKVLQAELDKSFQTSGAMRVYRDPKTGEFVQQDEESSTQATPNEAAIGQRAAKAKQSAPIAVKRHANGMSSATMGESGMHYSTVHRHADGSIHTDCADDHSVSQALTKPASQAKGEKNVR
jgi:hypothetical protein